MEKSDNEEQLDRDRYRFGGFRYGFRGPDKWLPSDYIPQIPSFYAYPNSSTDSRKLLNNTDNAEDE